jgi:H+-transporting ATPase
MPTVLSVTMAVGAEKLAKKQAIVSRLAAIEELAGMDILCSDKTGTLTLNQLTLGEPFCLDEFTPESVIFYAALASRYEDQDAIDAVILEALKDQEQFNSYSISQFQPFDPVSKRTEATVQTEAGLYF